MGNQVNNKAKPAKLTWKSTGEDVARFYNADLKGKVAVITGANSGIGFETARVFAGCGARTYMACRSKDRAQKAKTKLVKQGIDASLLIFLPLDLEYLVSVTAAIREIYEEEKKIDFLILNAAIMACPFGKTKEGFEKQLGINHIGHYAFATRLLNLLEKGDKARIIILSSVLQCCSGKFLDFTDLNWEKRSYSTWDAYSASKEANLLFGMELQSQLSDKRSEVTVHSAYPGIVRTNLSRYKPCVRVIKPAISVAVKVKSPAQGSATTMFCALDPGLPKKPGRYYSNFKEKTPSARADDALFAKQLWDLTEDMVAKYLR